MQQPQALPRRLNGRAAACDPCRARKLACDHSQPVCKRCKKRGNEINCVYREPALRGATANSRGTDDTMSASTTMPRPRPHQSPLSSMSVLVRAANISLSTPASPSSEPPPIAPPLVPGFWGVPSHGSVFDETKNSLAMFASIQQGLEQQPAGESSPGMAVSAARNDLARIPFRDRPGHFRDMCLYVLRCMPGQANEILTLGGAYTGMDPAKHKTWGDILVDHVSSSLLGCLDEIRHLGEDGLVALAEMLCDNTAKPMKDDCETHIEWLEQFSGPRLRWEALGLLLLYLDRVSDIFDAVTESRLQWAGGKPSPEIVNVCVKHCIEIASSLAVANVLLVDLNRRACAQDSMVHGDGRKSSLQYYQA